jgi:hypothetical protein
MIRSPHERPTAAISDAQGGLINALISIGGTAAEGAVASSGGTLATAIAATAATIGAGGLIDSGKWLSLSLGSSTGYPASLTSSGRN